MSLKVITFLNHTWLVLLLIITTFGFFKLPEVNGLSFNFTWDNVMVYGQGSLTSSDTTILTSPHDFVITSNNDMVVVSETGAVQFSNLSPTQHTSYTGQNNINNTAVEQVGNDLYTGGIYAMYKATNRDMGTLTLVVNNTQNIGYFISGMTYNQSSNILYVSDLNHNRILTYNPSDLGSPLSIVYGQNDLSGILANSPTLSASSLAQPRKTTLDCNGGLWAADNFNRRVLYYPPNSKTATIVLGQPDMFTNTTGGRTSNSFLNPKRVAFSQDCKVMFVADGNRVLRFRYPYSSGQSAEGVLGFSDFSTNTGQPPTDSSFYNVYTIQFVDSGDRSGTLYIADRNNNRIVSGITQLYPPSPTPTTTKSATNTATATATSTATATASKSLTPSKTPSTGASKTPSVSMTSIPSYTARPTPSPATVYVELNCKNDSSLLPETCEIDRDLIVYDLQVLFLYNFTKLIVTGNLTFYNNSGTILKTSQTVAVTEDVTFGGQLALILSSDLFDDGNSSSIVNSFNKTLFSYKGSFGNFSSIDIQGGGEEGSESNCLVTAEGKYNINSLLVLFDRQCPGEDTGDGINKNIVIGIVVGVTVCAILIIIILVVIGIVAVAIRFRPRLVAAKV